MQQNSTQWVRWYMFQLIKNILGFFKLTFKFTGEAIVATTAALDKVNDGLDKFNDELSIKNALSRLQVWTAIIDKQKQIIAIENTYTLNFLEEIGIFTEQSSLALEEVLELPQAHKSFSRILSMFKKEIQQSQSTREYKEIVSFCRENGLTDYQKVTKVFEFYFNTQHPARIEQEAKLANGVLFQIQNATKKVTEFRQKLV